MHTRAIGASLGARTLCGVYCKTKAHSADGSPSAISCRRINPIVTRILAECRHSAAALFFVSDFFADF
jgi:hypothetical protein